MADILLLGATGFVGAAVLRLALEEPRISQVVAPTRRALALQHQRLLNPIVDFDALDATAPYWKVDAVVSALGTTRGLTPSKADYERIEAGFPLRVAQLTKERGARAFAYVSSVGASSNSRSFYLRTKGQTEMRLREAGFPSLTLVRPSGIIGRRYPRRRLEEIALGAYQILRPALPRRWRVVTGPQVAKALLKAVLGAEEGTHVIESEALHD
jgi:uncharacterized protein YbjT (DUF2867 family)